MNIFNQIEHRRIKEGHSVQDFCKLADITTTTYHRYKNGESEPTFTVATRMMEVVGMKLLMGDKGIKKLDLNPEWGMMSLYFNSNKGYISDIFRNISGKFFVPDSFIFVTLKLALLSTWFHKSNQEVASKKFYDDVILTEYEITAVITKAKELGLLNVDNSPSNLAYEFYNKSVTVMYDYLSEADLVCKIK